MTAGADNPLARPLAALARVLDYPSATLQAHADELADILCVLSELSDAERTAVHAFIDDLAQRDLLEIQARYVDTFDRGRKVSLYVFEHVYGESRDRGPAMIELTRVYREHGLESHTRELPDFLPMLLEFCAQLPEPDARAWLVETTHVLQRISVRLSQRDSGYASAFTVLLRLIGAEPAPEGLTEMAGKEVRDDTPAAIDDVWMEKPVTFGPGEAHTNCGATRQNRPEPDTGSAPSAHIQGD
ncbi:nitrate reductase molybdenum cofactor assembly chaperone [Salinisphaera sp.]|uniref:nitrate reductase molybdenum cofactor assembly chaperone n=1 Tax=Salinisphaera sp. TaxID=1914330 RepID=UPI002D781D78|nr:nitrate reductase molybdenum cofactor assembly chaperone [Salinisphaera sp.]HET7314296.1 nitrate reductase molybdenum cofactor assembly chaperone [Salinisphaera sp.]